MVAKGSSSKVSQVLSGSAGDTGSWKQKEAEGRVVRKCARDPRGSGRAATKSATDKYHSPRPQFREKGTEK